MLSLEQLREIEPKMKDVPDEYLEQIRDQLYKLAELALESYFAEKGIEKDVKIL